MVYRIYPAELQLDKDNSSGTEASFLWGHPSFVLYHIISYPHTCFRLILPNQNIVPEKAVNIFVQILKTINLIIDNNMPVRKV